MAFFSRKPEGPFIKTSRIEMHWDVEDPFLFVSHHEDDYPQGNAQQAPPLAEIGGRDLGRDYQKRLGFRMYNGKVVPGFPMHAHWGYETVTLPEIGYVDHFDTEKIEGRFGFGDVQWVCASGKYEHNEMYPLVNQEDRNPNDITQIMINLPLELKNGENSVNTIWRDEIPVVEGDGCRIKVLCGTFMGEAVVSPSKVSWADGEHGVRILRASMGPKGKFTLDPAAEGANRNIYIVSGNGVRICGSDVPNETRVKMDGSMTVDIENGDSDSVVWVLEGVPIGQKMATFGPVTLRDTKEVRAALDDIRKNEFVEWPWKFIDQAQPLGTERFIRYPDGREIRPGN